MRFTFYIDFSAARTHACGGMDGAADEDVGVVSVVATGGFGAHGFDKSFGFGGGGNSG